ncbi:Uncharacterized protein NEOC65_001094 [Neochlamydia sp. AcF65]|uniref:hypothetical protein n=1 Tax=Neochlamydia sp. AcF65 TaxID=2795735 RepID=UPI001BC95287|nr:hypothetical protein [Neochlamydia sp. AcF65]MBS4166017.1 Uncharacterized protein [Neochlamydia sp. AcF65]
MRIFLTLCLLLTALAACKGPQRSQAQSPISKDYSSDAFTRAAIRQATRLAHQHRWYLDDAWAYYNSTDSVHRLCLNFRTQNILELYQARAQLVDVVEELLQNLKSNPQTSSRLAPNFSAGNLLIRVDFQSFWGIYGDPKYVGWMALENGMVYYYDFDVKDKQNDQWCNRIETYNKSKEIALIEKEAEKEYKDSLPAPKRVFEYLNE